MMWLIGGILALLLIGVVTKGVRSMTRDVNRVTEKLNASNRKRWEMPEGKKPPPAFTMPSFQRKKK
jgi:hypothetical protein